VLHRKDIDSTAQVSYLQNTRFVILILCYRIAIYISIMCHGHPHYHECQHTSVKWLYCPEAGFDLETGYETPCSNPIYSAPQPSSLSCPLQNCHYKTLRGSWTCCRCGYESNTQGWCDGQVEDAGGYRLEGFPPPSVQTCGHGCCSKCIGNGKTSSPSYVQE
jgi:hypothetical protein